MCKKVYFIISIILFVSMIVPVKVSGAAPISAIDASKSTYDRIVMKVDGTPFFFNGIQIRVD